MLVIEEKSSIAARLKQMCDSEGMTWKQFAEALQINDRTLGNYSRAGAYPSWDFLVAVHRYGFNLDFVLTGEGEMYRANRADVRQDVAVSYARDSNVVTTGVNNGHIVAEVGIQRYNTDSGGRGQRLCEWIADYAASHSDADVGCLVERMRRAFPEFEGWERK